VARFPVARRFLQAGVQQLFSSPSQVQKNARQFILLHEIIKKKTAWRIGGDANHPFSRGF
jgi:hypothetical protein